MKRRSLIIILFQLLVWIAMPAQAESDKELFLQAESLLQATDNPVTAADRFSKVIENEPEFALAYAHRAWCHYLANDKDSALTDINQAIKIDSTQAKYYLFRGCMQLSKNNYPAALRDFDQSLGYKRTALAICQKGCAYARSRRYDLAIIQFSDAIQLQPEDGCLYNYRSSAYGKVGRNMEKSEDYRMALKLKSGNFVPTFNRVAELKAGGIGNEAWIYRDLGLYGMSLRCYRAYLQKCSDANARQGEQAVVAALASERQDFDRFFSRLQARSLREKRAAAPIVTAYSGSATACMRSGRYIEAVEHLNRAIRSAPQDTKLLMMRAEAHARLGKNSLSLEDLTLVLRIDPKNISALKQRAAVHIKSNQTEQALSDLAEITRIQPGNVEAYKLRAMIFEKAGNYAGSAEEYSKLIALGSIDASFLELRAQAYEKAGNLPKALQDYQSIGTHGAMQHQINIFDRLIKGAKQGDNANLSNLYSSRAGMFERIGDTNKAIADYEQSLKLRPDKSTSEKLTLLRERIGRESQKPRIVQESTQETIERLSAVLLENAKDVDSRLRRAQAFSQAGLLAKAKADLDFIIEIDSNNVGAYCERASILSREGAHEQALNDYSRCIQLAPTDGALYFRRAEVYKKINNLEMAQKDLEQASLLHVEGK